MLAITIGTKSTTYSYSGEGDLTAISYATGSKRTFQYDSNSLYAGSRTYSDAGELTASLSLTHSWNGRLQMNAQPRNLSLEILYDTLGNVLSTAEKDELPIIQIDRPQGQVIMLGDQASVLSG